MPKSYYIRVCALFSAILLICNIVAVDTSFAGFVAIENYNSTWLGSCGTKYKYTKKYCEEMNKKQSNDICGGKSTACVCDSKYTFTKDNCAAPKKLGGKQCEGKYTECTCDAKYKFTAQQCTDDNKIPDGEPCDGKYTACVCDTSVYKETKATCELDNKIVDKTQMCDNNSKACVCDTSVYKETEDTCNALGKILDKTQMCDNNSKACVCDSNIYNLEACPANADCNKCSDTNGSKFTFVNCQDGYTQTTAKDGTISCEANCVPNDCSQYTLSDCPTGGICDFCEKGCGDTTKKYKVTGCKDGYVQKEGVCESCQKKDCTGYDLVYCPSGANCEECTKGCGDTTTKYKVTGCQVETTTCGSEYNLYSCPSGWKCDECKSYSCGDYGPVLSVRYRKTCMEAPVSYCVRPYMDKCPDNGYCNKVTFCGGITKYELRFDATGGCKYGAPIKHNCGYECPGEPANTSGNSTSTRTSSSKSYCGYGSKSDCENACMSNACNNNSNELNLQQKCSTKNGSFCGKNITCTFVDGCTSSSYNNSANHMCDCSVPHISSTGLCNGILCNTAKPTKDECKSVCQ